MSMQHQARSATLPRVRATDDLVEFLRETGPEISHDNNGQSGDDVNDRRRYVVKKALDHYNASLDRSRTAIKSLWQCCSSIPSVDRIFRTNVLEADPLLSRHAMRSRARSCSTPSIPEGTISCHGSPQQRTASGRSASRVKAVHFDAAPCESGPLSVSREGITTALEYNRGGMNANVKAQTNHDRIITTSHTRGISKSSSIYSRPVSGNSGHVRRPSSVTILSAMFEDFDTIPLSAEHNERMSSRDGNTKSYVSAIGRVGAMAPRDRAHQRSTERVYLDLVEDLTSHAQRKDLPRKVIMESPESRDGSQKMHTQQVLHEKLRHTQNPRKPPPRPPRPDVKPGQTQLIDASENVSSAPALGLGQLHFDETRPGTTVSDVTLPPIEPTPVIKTTSPFPHRPRQNETSRERSQSPGTIFSGGFVGVRASSDQARSSVKKDQYSSRRDSLLSRSTSAFGSDVSWPHDQDALLANLHACELTTREELKRLSRQPPRLHMPHGGDDEECVNCHPSTQMELVRLRAALYMLIA